MARFLKLSQGKYAKVDDFNYDWLNLRNWSYMLMPDGQEYAIDSDGNYLHRVIMGNPEGKQVDHIKGGGLNNLESNLRLATNAQNQMNAKIRRTNKSGFRGVDFYKRTGQWRAQIGVNGKSVHLGMFSSLLEAVLEWDLAAKKYFGKFANTNIF